MIFTLWFWVDDGVGEGEVAGQSSDVITRLVIALNWEMVARMVGERFSFLSLWDHTQPRHWKGTTFTNSSYETVQRNVKSKCPTGYVYTHWPLSEQKKSLNINVAICFNGVNATMTTNLCVWLECNISECQCSIALLVLSLWTKHMFFHVFSLNRSPQMSIPPPSNLLTI